ncbi:MAG: hypothetical protein KAW92_10625 [Candidatus Cloacimonetes bacterium]|nr:hypothetical protein [Candidatus Cloacimonadota bacterium]
MKKKIERTRTLAKKIDKLQTKEHSLRAERLKLEKQLCDLEEQSYNENFDVDLE